MNKKLRCQLCSCFLLFSIGGFAQVNVNPFYGTANVLIPIYTLNWGQVTVPVSISYNTNGVKPKDVEGTAGMNWQLNGGGQVSREVRGIPDDCTKDNSGNARLGWMSTSNSSANYISTFTPQNNNVNCTYGTNDISNLNTNVSDNHDTEPDIFYVNAPGLTCEMIYDRATSSFHPMNYQDLVISYAVRGGSGNTASEITSFTITNDKGMKFVFARPDSVIETTVSGPSNYFNKKYTRYQHGITYSDSWNISSITDVNGNQVLFTYNLASARYSTDPVELFFYSGGSWATQIEYQDMKTVFPQNLSSILPITILGATGPNSLTFTWNPSRINTGQPVVNTIAVNGRNLQFYYKMIGSTAIGSVGYQRAFLTNFVDLGCGGSPINYRFSYNGVDTSWNRTNLADSASKQLDYWGYYSSSASSSTLVPLMYVNPSTTGYSRYAPYTTSSPGSAYAYSVGASNRSVTPSSISDGALDTIINVYGGVTTIAYEPNDYYDVPSGSVVQGGGIRVKQVTESTGSGSGNDIVRNYSYVNPSGVTNAGLSSGVPVTLPQYAFTYPYSGAATGLTLWEDATALSAYDLSPDDHSIMYAYAKVSQTGAGSTQYHYSVAGNYWDASATPVCSGCSTTEWYPSVNDAAGYNCSTNYGPIANLNYSYPFMPNPNYDFERGLPISIISYNDSGSEISEADYTYQRSYTPTKVTAFKSEEAGSGAKFYNTYSLFYNTSELPYTVTKKVYDSNNAGQAQTSATTYTFGSAYHKLMTKQSATNSDNSTVNTFYTYVKDYGPTYGATNPNINALYNLKTLNVNAPVENYQQVVRGGTTVTTGAGLTLYSPSVNGTYTNYLPSQQLKMVQPDGQSFTPFSFSVSAQTISYDSKYIIAANFDKYDEAGNLITADDNFKHLQTSFFDQASNHPTVVFKNANYNEVAFNDFDSKVAGVGNLFTLGGSGSFYGSSGHSGSAQGIAANTQTVTASNVTKNAAALNYIFSIWLYPTAAGTISFTGVSGISPISYTATGSGYYEIKIPASSLSSTFTLGFTSSQNITIDDVMLYPDVAEVSTATYDNYQHFKIAETNTNGVSAYYTNDTWGRILYAFDQDKNVTLRKQYATPFDFQHMSTPVISADDDVYAGLSASFTNSGITVCHTDFTYTWDWGDGTRPTVVTFVHAVSHTYALSGNYTLTVTVSSPILGSKTGTLAVTVN